MATKKRLPLSVLNSLPKASGLDTKRKVYRIHGIPGLYRAVPAETNDSFRCLYGQNIAWMLRDELLERELSEALRESIVSEGDRFICDSCGCPAPTIAIRDNEARCAACAREMK